MYRVFRAFVLVLLLQATWALDPFAVKHDGLLLALRSAGFNAFVDVISASPHLQKAFDEGTTTQAPQASWEATVFAPTDKAVASWLKSMSLTLEDLETRPHLAAMVAGYHLTLEAAFKLPEDLKSPSTVVSTASPLWEISLSRQPSGKSNGGVVVVATDAQNRRALVTTPPAAHYGKIVIYSIDSVLMNGDYFTTLDSALNYYEQMSSIRTAISRVPSVKDLTTSSSNELTWFLPMDKGVAGRKIDTSSEPQENLAFELPYHILEGPVQSIPNGITANKEYGTMLEGTVLSLEYSKPEAVPVSAGSQYQTLAARATVLTQDKDTAAVVVPNIFVGRGILHVLDKTILAPPLPDMPAGLFDKLYGANGLAQKKPKNVDIIKEFIASRQSLNSGSKRKLMAVSSTHDDAATTAVTTAQAARIINGVIKQSSRLSRRMLNLEANAAGTTTSTQSSSSTTTTTTTTTAASSAGCRHQRSLNGAAPVLDEACAHLLASVLGGAIVGEPGVSSSVSQQLQRAAAKQGLVSYSATRIVLK